MTRIVINKCYGGFGLSELAEKEYCKLAKIDSDKCFHYSIPRDDKNLVKVVDKYGMDSFGSYAFLKIVEIPDDVEWEIQEYDGKEWVAEVHRTWD
jgi:hypothetical protein